MKQVFIKSVVRVVARDGLGKATTKVIATEAKLNEAYIYQCFSNKDELLSEAFYLEDKNFVQYLHEALPVMRTKGISWRDRVYQLWIGSWRYMLEKEDDCYFYLRYYYSAQCRTRAYATHLKFFHELIDSTRPTFKPETNVDMLIHQIFDTMLSFAARVLGGEMENNEETAKWVFEQIYSFVIPNVKPEVLEAIL